MKKLILSCALIAGATIVSFAQNAHPVSHPGSSANAKFRPAANSPEGIAAKRAEVYKKQLGLNNEQYKGVYDAELSYARQDQQLRANGNKPGEGQVMQMGMGRDQKIRNVITSEQYAKYDKLKSKTSTATSTGR